jgi:hypothetical protein
MELEFIDEPATDFLRRIGRLELHDFQGLGIEPTVSTGAFYEEGMPRLHDYVRRTPGCHIATGFRQPNVTVNHFDERGYVWYLCFGGDQRPQLANLMKPLDLAAIAERLLDRRSGAQFGEHKISPLAKIIKEAALWLPFLPEKK